MLTLNISIIFAFGIVITLIVLKGVLQAQEFARQDESKASQNEEEYHSNTENVGY